MACYVHRIRPPTHADFKVWQDIGYTGTWENYCADKSPCIGMLMFINGELGPHCADCSDLGDFLCDYPVGEGQTCDRSICPDHSVEVAPEIHYCTGHYAMWQKFKAEGGVEESLRNVIAFKSEK